MDTTPEDEKTEGGQTFSECDKGIFQNLMRLFRFNLSGSDYKTLLSLLWLADAAGEAMVHSSAIALSAGLSPIAARRSLKHLREAGLVKKSGLWYAVDPRLKFIGSDRQLRRLKAEWNRLS